MQKGVSYIYPQPGLRKAAKSSCFQQNPKEKTRPKVGQNPPKTLDLNPIQLLLHIYICVYIYIYMYMYTFICAHIPPPRRDNCSHQNPKYKPMAHILQVCSSIKGSFSPGLLIGGGSGPEVRALISPMRAKKCLAALWILLELCCQGYRLVWGWRLLRVFRGLVWVISIFWWVRLRVLKGWGLKV